MNLDLRKLRHFVAIARLQSFSRAANTLNITQPALSRSIKSLEAQYATRLFDRSRAGVHLTAKGQELSNLAKELLQAAESVEQHFLDAGSGAKGNLAFGMAPLPAKIFLPQLVPRTVGWQCGRINAAVQRTETLISLLLNGELEFLVAPVIYGSLSKLLDIEELATIPVQLFVRAKHPLSAMACVTQNELSKYPVLTTGLHNESFSGLGFGKPFIVTDNITAATDIVRQSDVICLTGAPAVAHEVESGALVALPLAEKPIDDALIGIFKLQYRLLGPLADRAVTQIKLLAEELELSWPKSSIAAEP